MAATSSSEVLPQILDEKTLLSMKPKDIVKPTIKVFNKFFETNCSSLSFEVQDGYKTIKTELNPDLHFITYKLVFKLSKNDEKDPLEYTFQAEFSINFMGQNSDYDVLLHCNGMKCRKEFCGSCSFDADPNDPSFRRDYIVNESITGSELNHLTNFEEDGDDTENAFDHRIQLLKINPKASLSAMKPYVETIKEIEKQLLEAKRKFVQWMHPNVLEDKDMMAKYDELMKQYQSLKSEKS